MRGDFECIGCALFVTPDDKCSEAVDGRLVLGQFVVARGEHVSGTLNLLLLDGRQEEAVDIVTILCPADLDGDGTVAVSDLLLVLSVWGPCEDCPEDLDGNGFVGVSDLLEVLAAWGPCS